MCLQAKQHQRSPEDRQKVESDTQQLPFHHRQKEPTVQTPCSLTSSLLNFETITFCYLSNLDGYSVPAALTNECIY